MTAVPNSQPDPGAEVQSGYLPFSQTCCVHTVNNVSVFAAGTARFNTFIDNTGILRDHGRG
jgi:alkaline phosphatase